MQNIEIRDDRGRLLVEFNGRKWKVYTEDEEPEVVTHDLVRESPFYLCRHLEQAGGLMDITLKLSKQSSEPEELFRRYWTEESALRGRIVLWKEDGYGMVDEFTDVLYLLCHQPVGLEAWDGFTIGTSIIDDLSYNEYARNALGEIPVDEQHRIKTAEELYGAIVSITSDDRWDGIEWTWEGILASLAPYFPDTADELAEVVSVKTGRKVANQTDPSKRPYPTLNIDVIAEDLAILNTEGKEALRERILNRFAGRGNTTNEGSGKNKEGEAK